jgi:hypothetical protein
VRTEDRTIEVTKREASAMRTLPFIAILFMLVGAVMFVTDASSLWVAVVTVGVALTVISQRARRS